MDKTKIMVWFDFYESLASKEGKDDLLQDMMEDVDLVLAPAHSLQGAKERVYSNKVHELPEDIDNEDAVHKYCENIIDGEFELMLVSDVVCKILDMTKEEIRSKYNEFLGAYNSENPNIKSVNIAKASDDDLKELPKVIRDAMRGVRDACQQAEHMSQEIVSEYMTACNIQNIPEKQAEEEGQSYLASKIPADEFICPVGILDKLKNL